MAQVKQETEWEDVETPESKPGVQEAVRWLNAADWEKGRKPVVGKLVDAFLIAASEGDKTPDWKGYRACYSLELEAPIAAHPGDAKTKTAPTEAIAVGELVKLGESARLRGLRDVLLGQSVQLTCLGLQNAGKYNVRDFKIQKRGTGTYPAQKVLDEAFAKTLEAPSNGSQGDIPF